jgi:hypothetical protein
VNRWFSLVALTTALAAGLTATASGARSDSFYANIRSVSYGGGAFFVSGDSVFDLLGCRTYDPDCSQLVDATFELRRGYWRHGGLISQTHTQTHAGSGSLRAVLWAPRCRRPRGLAPPHRTVKRRYTVVLRAVAFTGRTAVASRYTFLICLRP